MKRVYSLPENIYKNGYKRSKMIKRLTLDILLRGFFQNICLKYVNVGRALISLRKHLVATSSEACALTLRKGFAEEVRSKKIIRKIKLF